MLLTMCLKQEKKLLKGTVHPKLKIMFCQFCQNSKNLLLLLTVYNIFYFVLGRRQKLIQVVEQLEDES